MLKSFISLIGNIYISELEESLKGIPQSNSDMTLYVKKYRDSFRFYSLKKGSSKQQYLGNDQISLIKELAQQEYYDEARAGILELIQYMKDFLKGLDSIKAPEEVYEELPEPRKTIVTKLVTTDVKKWKDQYRKLPKDFPVAEYPNLIENHPIEAKDGRMVRSKSEALIISVCIELGLEYVYEYPIYIDGTWYYPDFRILNVRTGEEFIYEHFGGVDSPGYVEKNLIKKLNDYKKEKINLCTNLVCTFETKEHPLCEREVRDFLILHFL